MRKRFGRRIDKMQEEVRSPVGMSECTFSDMNKFINSISVKTMVREPYVHHVPLLTGGRAYDGVYNFCRKEDNMRL
jgi:hypothetical protein